MSKFLSKFKGSKEERSDLNPTSFSSNNPYRHTQTQPPEYAPPVGPPPSEKNPAQLNPASASNEVHESPPPYHDWTSIPDTALLPPPPSLNAEYSSTTNANCSDADAAHAWCASHPVHIPSRVHDDVLAGVLNGSNSMIIQSGNLKLDRSSKPQSTNSLGFMPTKVDTILRSVSGFRNRGPLTDHCTHSDLPLYFAANSNPLLTEQPFTIYFEVKLLKLYSKDSTLAIGFIARPYPMLRQPGWHRASVGVHSDDGHRYVNDSWGGLEFTEPFKEGETIGFAMQFLTEPVQEGNSKTKVLTSEMEVGSTLPKCKTKVFLIRNRAVTGSWNIDEERDAEHDEGIAGLQGEADMYAAVGTYGDVDFEVHFYRNGEGFVAPPST